jgi:hypothetical protein
LFSNVFDAYATVDNELERGGTGMPATTTGLQPGGRAVRIEIVHRQTAAVVASWKEFGQTADGLAQLIRRDLDSLSANEFEAEWNVAPPSPT